MDEMYDNDLDIDDVIEILEEGFDCSRSKRSDGITERCIQKGDKIVKAVVAETDCHYVITHVGVFTASRRKLTQFKRRR